MATDSVTVTITISAGNHHNNFQTSDSDQILRKCVRLLIMAGCTVTAATHVSVSSGTDNLLTDLTNNPQIDVA